MTNDPLRAVVTRTYRLGAKRLLVLADDYEGGVDVGDRVQVELADGRTAEVAVDGVAWGSSYDARNPPLTIVAVWDDADPDPLEGAKVVGRSLGSEQRAP